jgi:hypothetical protein
MNRLSRCLVTTLRKRRILLLLVLAAGGRCFSQTNLCELPFQGQGHGFAPPLNADAYEVLDSIGKVVPFQTRTIRLFPSSADLVKQRGGAAAIICGQHKEDRWIFFDPTYIEKIKDQSNLARYFVLAHEAAHHINGDTLIGNNWSKDEELAADYSAAVWLARLGVTRDELLQTFDKLNFPEVSVNGYPTRAERRAKVIQAYEFGSSKNEGGGGRPLKVQNAIPDWFRGNWSYDIDNKPMPARLGNVTCPYGGDFTVGIEQRDDRMTLFYNVSWDEFRDGHWSSRYQYLDCYNGHTPAAGEWWAVRYYITIEQSSQDEVAFRAEMEKCLVSPNCRIPPNNNNQPITGTIARRNDGRLRLILNGMLSGDFTLQAEH